MRQRLSISVALLAISTVFGARGIAETPTADSARPATSRRADEPRPVFTFGLVADVQYADKPTRRFSSYRDSIERLRQCVDAMNRNDVDFTVQLGDVVDGYIRPDKTTQLDIDVLKTRRDLDRILPGFTKLDKRVYHVVGNHCLRAGREELQKKLGLARTYYDFTPEGVEGWRLVVLDGNIGGYGALGKEQIQWLTDTLAKAKEHHEKVILLCHFPLFKQSGPRYHMISPKPVDRLIDQAGCVVAYFAGHDHVGGYAEVRGVHHVTLQGMVESGSKNAYAIVEAFPDRLEVRGFGKVPSRTLALKREESKAPPSSGR